MGVAYATVGLRFGSVFKSLGQLRPPIMLWVVTAVMIAGGLLTILAAWKDYHQARRTEKGLCPTCGYDLRASPERCPECGMIATSEKASPEP
jgi:hypothetical protein